MRKKVLKAVITGGKDQYGIWIDNVQGIFSAGDTVEETKQNLQESIDLFIECHDPANVPDILKGNYTIDYTFDTSGFLKYYSKYISFAGMKEITGLNQKQLWSYANGYRVPNSETSKKIMDSIHLFGKEISQIQLRI